MIDDVYKNAFKEVYEILQNTDEELIKKVPEKFIDFLKNNMNNEYKTNINARIPINKQSILSESEEILSLIFRSYWATDEEKIEFANKDKQDFIENEKYKEKQYKDITEIFKEKKNINKVTLDTNLIVSPKENIIKKWFKKLLNVLNLKYSKK